MSDPKDKQPPKAPQPNAAEDKRSGRAGFDERGNSVWEWQLETGVYSRDVPTQRLKKLELGDLSLAETAIQPRPPGLGGAQEKPKAPKPAPGGGFNPYDNANKGAGFNPYDTASQRAQKAAAPAPATGRPVRTPEELRKLDEFLKMKRRLEEQKKDEDE